MTTFLLVDYYDFRITITRVIQHWFLFRTAVSPTQMLRLDAKIRMGPYRWKCYNWQYELVRNRVQYFLRPKLLIILSFLDILILLYASKYDIYLDT